MSKEKNYNKIFNNVSYFIKNHILVNCLQDGFVMYYDKVLICEIEVIPPIPDSMILVDCCQKHTYKYFLN